MSRKALQWVAGRFSVVQGGRRFGRFNAHRRFRPFSPRLVTFFMPSEAVAACFGHTVVHAAITQPHEHVPYGLRPIAANSGDSDIAHLPSASRTAAVRGVDGE